MTTFQPGDVVRLTGDAWGDHASLPELPGSEQMLATHDTFWFKGGLRLSIDTQARPDEGYGVTLVPTGTLPPQAVLDAMFGRLVKVSDAIAADWGDYTVQRAGRPFTLTARKVDGHWQVKSVGGGE